MSGQVVDHPHRYQVDGEVGRFTFKTYDVVTHNKQPIFTGLRMFPGRKAKQWYPTCGFKQVTLLQGAAQRSYRQTIQLFKRSCRQEKGGTPLTTLHDVAESEGLKVLDFLTCKTAAILKQFQFTEQGQPAAACAVLEQIPKEIKHLTQKTLQPVLHDICNDMINKGISTENSAVVQKAATENLVYEDRQQTVYVHIDDVLVKEQKAHRNKHQTAEKQDENQPNTHKTSRQNVQNTVARIEHQGKGFTLTGRSVDEILLFLLAFLLNNQLLTGNLKICTDGLCSLQNAILAFFAWHPHVSLLLDWFHLVKKFKEELSTACCGREIRNFHLKQLVTLLWFGLIDQAQAYLASIPKADLKNCAAINRLNGYLERNRRWIPCYALRSKLNLPNSSSPVERSNNQVTAMRQKHHGMSWSENGSYALTALNAVAANHATTEWLESRFIPFVLVAKAA